MATVYLVGEWEVHPKSCRLVRNGTERRLSPRSINVLVYLAERAGAAVTHEELLTRFWRGAFSSPNAVHKCVAELRHAFGNGGGEPDYIETVPKRGYRLLAPVELIEKSMHVRHGPRTLSVHLIAVGDRSVVLLPDNPHPKEGGEQRYFEMIEAGMVARMSKLAGATVRTQTLTVNEGAGSGLAAELGVDYMMQIDLREHGDRLQASVRITPRSGADLRPDQFEVASGDRERLVDDLTTRVTDDLDVLLDERRLAQMAKWGTTNIRAYRYALEADAFQRIETVESLARAEELFNLAICEDDTFRYGYLSLCAVYHAQAIAAKDPRTRELVRGNVLALLRDVSVRQPGSDIAVSIERAYRSLSVGNAFDAEVLWRNEVRSAFLSNEPQDFQKSWVKVEALRRYSELLLGAQLVLESEAYNALAMHFADEAWRPHVESHWAQLATARGDHEEAVRRHKINIDLFPDSTVSLHGLIWSLASLGRFAEAEAYLARLRSVDSGWSFSAKVILMAYRGDLPIGSPRLDQVLAKVNKATAGIVSFILGDVDGGVRYWRRIEPTALALQWQSIGTQEPFWAKGVTNDPRYQTLLDELDIGKKWRSYVRRNAAELAAITGVKLATPFPIEDLVR